MSETTLGGIPVMVTPILPIYPSPGTWARRFVRHGLADILAWIGEDVGPTPGELTEVIYASDGSRDASRGILWVSQEKYEALREAAA